MKRRRQSRDEIVDSLQPLEADWQDETATEVIAAFQDFPRKSIYALADLEALLDRDFKVGLLVTRLFLGLSDDDLETALKTNLGPGGTGAGRYRSQRAQFLAALVQLGILDAMADIVNRPLSWSDVLVERLRSSRGRAIRGQRRGRNLEDFVERIVREVFGSSGYETRCQFVGANGESAKCDFAIPNKTEASVLVEVKGYGATGSKMSDVLGDLNIIIGQKRHDTTLLLVTDGVTWKRRLGDLDRIVALQNKGLIARIYTTRMAEDFRRDLETLRTELRLASP